MTSPLAPQETVITGEWLAKEGKVVADSSAERIDYLVANYLVEVTVKEGTWTKLFKDPEDGRFWELSYPQGHMHGGGPPKLQVLSRSMARELYGDAVEI